MIQQTSYVGVCVFVGVFMCMFVYKYMCIYLCMGDMECV